MNRLCFIDVETTGLNANKHAIIQLAYIIEVNGEVTTRGQFRINPFSYNKAVEVEPAALEASGVTIENLEHFQDSTEAFNDFKEVLNANIAIGEKLTFVAYNSPFDIKFVQAWFKDNNRSNDYGYYFTYKDLDVFAFFKYLVYIGYFKDLVSHKLSDVYKYCLGITFNAHDAMEDIEATRALHHYLVTLVKVPDGI